MAAPLGNQYSKKLKTPELKAEAYRQYCAHIAQGYSKENFCFEHPDLTVTWETVETYIKNEPKDFPPIQKQIANCKSYKIWETIVMESARGENEKANTATLQMIMRNKFGWDKKTDEGQNVSESTLEAHERLARRLGELRKEQALCPSEKA